MVTEEWMRGPGPTGQRQAPCPFPDCRCTHTQCVRGWLDLPISRPDQRNYDLAKTRVREMRQLHFTVGQIGQVLLEEGLTGPVPGSRTIPCPQCRPDQSQALRDPTLSRTAAMHKLRNRDRSR